GVERGNGPLDLQSVPRPLPNGRDDTGIGAASKACPIGGVRYGTSGYERLLAMADRSARDGSFPARPEDELGTAKKRQGTALHRIGHDCVPHLRRVAEVCRRSYTREAALARGAEKVGLQLDGGEVLGTRRQVSDAAVATGCVRERNNG